MLKKMFANLFLGLTAAGLGQLNAAGLDLTSGGLTLKAEPSGELSGLLVDNREYLAGAQQPFSAFAAAETGSGSRLRSAAGQERLSGPDGTAGPDFGRPHGPPAIRPRPESGAVAVRFQLGPQPRRRNRLPSRQQLLPD